METLFEEDMVTIEYNFLEISEKIFEIMKDNDISYEELSNRTGITIRKLKFFLNNHSNIRIRELLQIIYALQADITLEFKVRE